MSSIFLGDYLTSEGQAVQADLDLLADGGFVVEERDRREGSREAAVGRPTGEIGVTVRRRGPGTAAAPNA